MWRVQEIDFVLAQNSRQLQLFGDRIVLEIRSNPCDVTCWSGDQFKITRWHDQEIFVLRSVEENGLHQAFHVPAYPWVFDSSQIERNLHQPGIISPSSRQS